MSKSRFAKRPSQRTWMLILGGIFILSLVASYLISAGGVSGKIARIYVDGELYREIDLSAVSSPFEFTIETGHGFNTISVRSGGIRVSEADCSDHTCVKQGWLTGGSAPIVCLPHLVTIQLEEAVPADAPDAIAG